MLRNFRALFLLSSIGSVATSLASQAVAEACIGRCSPDAEDETLLARTQLLQHELSIGKVEAIEGPREISLAEEPTTATTTPPPTGMAMNGEDDWSGFLIALITTCGALGFFLGIGSYLRLRYPLIYSNNVLKGFAPANPPPTAFSWLKASLHVTIDEATDSIGLDNAMMLEFTHLGMRIMATIGIPMIIIGGLMNLIFGGNAAENDYLSYLSFGNVCTKESKVDSCLTLKRGGPDLYWVHAFMVWGVVYIVQSSVHRAQRDFLPRRFNWLRGLPEKRANTILVTGIPEEFQSDQKLKEFFSTMLPGDDKVAQTYSVKETSGVRGLACELKAARKGLVESKAAWTNAGGTESARPMVRESLLGAKVDAIEYYSRRVEELKPVVREAQAEIMKQSMVTGGVNLSTGFVTFRHRHDAEIALRLELSSDQDEWVMLTPPEPTDILWNDLTQDPIAQKGRTIIGYLLLAGFFFAYLPIIIGITNIAKIINLGPFQPIWQGLAPTLGLQFMVAFLPTFLILIFQFFFTVYAEAWTQAKLQKWYFWFQFVFIILATAVGQNIVEFIKTLFQDPTSVFAVLSDTMPYATHFYMNFLVLQWFSHGMNFTRAVPLSKFILARALYDDEDARELAEPEDQDYYGIGSRSARWNISLLVGIIFGTLSPPICLFCFMDFLVMRVIYGYLICFAETKKADLGGVFWSQNLRNIFFGNLCYTILMTGVLARRATSWGPAVIAAPTILYVLLSLRRFDEAFSWEKLPFSELMGALAEKRKTRDMEGTYSQPELLSQDQRRNSQAVRL
mmetsp:Transcript_47808/g.102477  ORF Transcript_47808/g.102477 Transcript_47808/m.102477 type:complete len:792 (-) Transcript_47808:98-2473(-)